MSPHLYHLCTSDFRGETLYPLASLATVYPDLYQRERTKYVGREAVLRFVVPHINVTWVPTPFLSTLAISIAIADGRQTLRANISSD